MCTVRWRFVCKSFSAALNVLKLYDSDHGMGRGKFFGWWTDDFTRNFTVVTLLLTVSMFTSIPQSETLKNEVSDYGRSLRIAEFRIGGKVVRPWTTTRTGKVPRGRYCATDSDRPDGRTDRGALIVSNPFAGTGTTSPASETCNVSDRIKWKRQVGCPNATWHANSLSFPVPLTRGVSPSEPEPIRTKLFRGRNCPNRDESHKIHFDNV